MTVQEQYEAAWQTKYGVGGTHAHRMTRGGYPPEDFCVHPMPHVCPRCGDRTNWCAVNDLYTRFVCKDCWHAWGTEREAQP